MASGSPRWAAPATDSAHHLHGEPTTPPRSERPDGQPYHAMTLDGARSELSGGTSEQVNRVLEDFAKALVRKTRPAARKLLDVGKSAVVTRPDLRNRSLHARAELANVDLVGILVVPIDLFEEHVAE